MKFKLLLFLISTQSIFAMDSELQNKLDHLSRYFGQKEYSVHGNKVIASEWKSDSWLDYFNPFASKNNGRHYKKYTRISNSQELSKSLFRDRDSCNEAINESFLVCSACTEVAATCGILAGRECLECTIACCLCSLACKRLGSYKKKKIFGNSDIDINKKIEEVVKLYRELQNPPAQNSII